MNDMEELYNDLIMDHSMHSPYKHALSCCDISAKGHNPSCGDEITLEVKIQEGVIQEMGFTGHGCAISQSSTSIMIETLTGKSVSEAKKIVETFLAMIRRERLEEEALDSLEDARAFQGIANMPARVKCALLAWKTLNEHLENL